MTRSFDTPITSRRKAMLKIQSAWKSCTDCKLHRDRNKVVFWRGYHGAPLGIIGEGPGEAEDRKGLPFVGRAGKLLDELLEHVGLELDRDVFVANVVGCRPPGNREPSWEEAHACLPRLFEMLDVVRPKAILLLGATAMRYLAGGKQGVNKHRGKRTQVVLRSGDADAQILPAVITFHPSFLLRNRTKDVRDKMLKDIRAAAAIADLVI